MEVQVPGLAPQQPVLGARSEACAERLPAESMHIPQSLQLLSGLLLLPPRRQVSQRFRHLLRARPELWEQNTGASPCKQKRHLGGHSQEASMKGAEQGSRGAPGR